MDPREVAIAILGRHQKVNNIDDMVQRKIPERLPAAAAASMAALKREDDCSTVLDFFSLLSRRRSISSSAASSNRGGGFKLIILAQFEVGNYSYQSYDGRTIFSALSWNPDSVDYIRARGHSSGGDAVTPNLIHAVEDPTLQWGVDALFFFLSQAQFEQILNLRLLATIPPVTALCLSTFALSVPRSTVRLYMCGLPLSGKTSISRSLFKWSKGSLPIWSRLKGIKLSDRTRGIEVTIIESPLDRQRISVWDMAGQLEYHSFHDSMLPDLGDLAIPSLFLFVWNPFKMNDQGELLRDALGGKFVVKHPNDFKDDFKYWLKFLASKTPKSNVLKPNVVVVVTREDLGLPDMKVELHTVFESLRVEFEDYIHLDMEGFFQVNAMNPNKVSILGSYLLKCTKAILEVAIDDFSICDEARNLFACWTRKGKIAPLITKERFFCLTQEKLGIHEEMCEAVARSLNSSGDVIFLPTLELVVMDTKWFCQKIMGDILHFDVKSIGSFTQHSSNGFFTPHYLERLLEEELIISRQGSKWRFSRTRDAPNSKESKEVAGSDLVKLLIGLQLACPSDNTQKHSDIFLPASLCGKARESLLPGKYLRLNDRNASHVGRRLNVRDSKRTFLTPGIFPRLQVTFHNMLTTRGVNVELEQDILAFADAGSRVLVEFCALEGREHFIDILVCSQHTSNEALEWVHEKVTAEMMKVFADPRGIPGVDLTHSVIQPACIRGLAEASQRQAVPIQILRDNLKEHIQKKGAKLLVNGAPNGIIYTWQTEPLADDDVMTLLGEAEVVKIIEAYMSSLKETAKDVLDISVEMKSREQKRPEFGTTQSQKQIEALFDLLQDNYAVTCEIRKDVKEVKAGVKFLSQQVEDLRGAVLLRLCELITFAKEGEAGKLPRMFVLTEEEGRVRRVVCRMVPGLHKLRLELLCECRNERAHLVNGQSGISITTLDEGLVKSGLPYIHGFLKVAYAATKIAAHVAVGCNDLIPDFTEVLANIVDAPEFGPSQPFSGFTDVGNSSSRIDLSSSQHWLFKVLSACGCTTSKLIYEQFGLCRIRYADSAVAWVCDKHCPEVIGRVSC
ncbi:hypothetical protein GOP47_0015770 [Adiantum capillus-veneris]|uniref:C-terminal of Roc (COR) domain-containing protein n=1 Tax=Adiantum capillus-veneris TaxID=13818 RepID=A0A9D4UKB0_ADICA|nr:hypothetical protein GOP47_0015770 [Adiantum capillus-veneris]